MRRLRSNASGPAAGDLMSRRRWLVLILWGLAFAAAVPLAQRQTDHLTHGGFVAADSASSTVDRAIEEFPVARQAQLAVLLDGRAAGPAARRRAVARARRGVAKVEGVSLTAVGAEERRRGRRSGLIMLPLHVAGGWDERIDAAFELRETLGAGEGAPEGVRTHLVGQDALWAAVQEVQKEQLAAAEIIGFPITLLILVVTFGAVAAGLLPLALGAVSVTMAGAAIWFVSQLTDVSVFVTNAASMIGIGVAIDYSLFVLARYRQEVAAGATPEAARATTRRTSGRAVVFSGITLVLSLTGVLLADSTTLRSMAVGMMIVVGVAVLAAITLLPALIAILHRRVTAPGRLAAMTSRVGAWASARIARHGESRDFWTRWSERVMRRPGLAALGASVLMLGLAAPVLTMEIRHSALPQLPADSEARRGTELAAGISGAGALGPIQSLVTFSRGTASTPGNAGALERHVAALRRQPGVARVLRPERHPDRRDRVLLTAIPSALPEAPEAQRAVRDIREEVTAPGGLSEVADVAVGGTTALLVDFNDVVESSMWDIALFIVVVGYLVLLVMFRSILLPLKAVGMTLLSVLASYGTLVILFQWGWLDGLLGTEAPGYVNSFTPPLLLAVTFGLSMDYEVFMLARIRESRRRGLDDRAAVARGLRETAGTITGAALIMVSVFAVFASVGSQAVKHLGLGQAVAIALDATLIRLVLVPSTMALLGRWNWWMPAFMARRIPRVALEDGLGPD